MTVPAAVHLLVRRSGGGAETNIRKLCAAVPEFRYVAMEDEMGWPLRWSRLPRLLARVRGHRPRIVFCYGVTTHVFAAAMLPEPILVGSIRCESDFAGWKGGVRTVLAPRFREWVSNSRAALQGWKGTVIHNGIEEPAPGEQALLPGLPKPVFGLLGRGHPKKGHAWMLDLWGRLGRPGSLVFGGDLDAGLRARAESEGAICPGFVAPGAFLRSIDLLCVPSTAEGIPTVMLEAMVRGVPCLATPVGGVEELVRHGQDGYCLPRDGWYDFLRTMDVGVLPSIGAAGRETVRRDWTLDKMVAGFTALATRLAPPA